MAFSGRSAKFLDSLGVPESYKGDVDDYMASLDVVNDDEDLTTGEWIAIGVVAAVVIGGLFVATGGLASVGITGIGGSTFSSGFGAALIKGGASIYESGVGITAFTKIAEAGYNKYTESTATEVLETGLKVYDQGSSLYKTYKSNSQAQDREDFARQKAKDIQANNNAGLQLGIDRLVHSFKTGAESVRSGLAKIEISLDQQEQKLESSTERQLLGIERQHIKTESDRATLELNTEYDVYKSNMQFDQTLHAIDQTHKNYNNSKDVLSSYRESSIITAKGNVLNTYGQGQSAWSNVFTVTDATISGESQSAQSNRRINQSSSAILKLLEVQDQVHQKVFTYKNQLSDVLLNIGEKRFDLESKYKTDKFNLNASLGGAGQTIDKVLKSYDIANNAINRFLDTLDAQEDLVQDDLIKGKANLESIYAEALKSAGFQKNQLLDNLNLATEEAYNRHKGVSLRNERLDQDPIGQDYDLKGTVGLYKDLTSTGLPKREEIRKIGDEF